jgi:hypothetical protein
MPVQKCGNFDNTACVHFIDATEQDEQVTVQNITFEGIYKYIKLKKYTKNKI